MIDNHNEETWIYFSQKIEKIAFFAPKLNERTVLLLKFKNNKLINKESFTQKDSKIIDISTKKLSLVEESSQFFNKFLEI